MIDNSNKTNEWKDTEKLLLVVDDSPTCRLMLGWILKNKWFNIIEAENWEEALKLIKEYKSKITWITLDHEMPWLTWIEVASEVKKIWINVKIIMVSWSEISEDIWRDAWIHNFLAKPINKEVLTTLLKVFS